VDASRLRDPSPGHGTTIRVVLAVRFGELKALSALKSVEELRLKIFEK